MEDENKAKKIINIIIAVLIIATITVIGIIVYQKIMQNINNDRFTSYINENNFKKDSDGIYTKTTNNGDEKTTYQALIDQYLLSKAVINTSNTQVLNIEAGYKQDGTIEISYKLEGYNSNHEIGTLYQKGTYKNGEFKCQIISNNGFKTTCPDMKKEAQAFEKEINQIFEKNNINVKYITLKDPNAI